MAFWQNKLTDRAMVDSFAPALKITFDHPLAGGGALEGHVIIPSPDLSCSCLVADYVVECLTLAVSSGWNAQGLLAAYVMSLSE